MKDDDDLIIFKLHREYPKEEVREMLKQEQKDLDNLNKLLYSKVLYPDIHRQMIELKKSCQLLYHYGLNSIIVSKACIFGEF